MTREDGMGAVCWAVALALIAIAVLLALGY